MAQKPGACVQTCQANADDEKARLTAEEYLLLRAFQLSGTPQWVCNAQSVCTGLEAGLHDLFGSLLFLHRAARVCSIVQDVQQCFIIIPHFVVASFSLNLAPCLLQSEMSQMAIAQAECPVPCSVLHCLVILGWVCAHGLPFTAGGRQNF